MLAIMLALGLLVSPVIAQALPTLTLEPTATATAPVYVAHAGDARLFIVERAGRVRVFVPGTGVLPSPFLDIRDLVDDSLDGGLYTIAFHPRYATNGYVYVSYTESGAPLGSVIARYRVSAADPNVADPTSARVLLRLAQPHASHNNGQIAFGPDGHLYVAFGDGGGGGGPECRAQKDDLLFGKVLRIDADANIGGAPFYGIPGDNPFASPSDGVIDEVWAKGFRNPWRFSFDRALGDLFIADVGQESREEIDLQNAASAGGQNYGWKVMEGTSCYAPDPVAAECPIGTPPCGSSVYTPPIFDYATGVGGDCSIIGGYRYRGASTDARGLYVFGDYCSGRIWALEETGPGTWVRTELGAAGFGVTSFGEGFDGELYVTRGANVLHLAFGGPAVAAVCGDGSVGAGESCDDGNAATGDGCDASCATEPGFTCLGEPSACTPRLDHFMLYRARASPRPDLPNGGRFPGPDWNVLLDDATLADGASDDPENHEVKWERDLALPAEADGVAAPSPATVPYVTYQIGDAEEGAGPFDPMLGRYPKPATRLVRVWDLASRFGSIRVQTRRPRMLWIATSIDESSPPPAPPGATPFVCYDAKATRDLSDQTPDTGAGRGRFRRDLQTFARDAFDDCALDRDGMPSFAGTPVAGTCLVTLRKPKVFCSAAGLHGVGGSPPRNTIATVAPAAPLRAGGLLCYKIRLATKLLSQDLLDAGVLDGLTPPAALFDRHHQRIHVRRLLERGTAPHATPGNGFPAPRQLDTDRLDLLCVPSTVAAVSG